jgi:hypothetical protein
MTAAKVRARLFINGIIEQTGEGWGK